MPWQITRYSCPGTVKIKLCPVSARFFSPFLSLPSPLHSPSFFLFPCPLLHSPFCWEVRIQGGGGSPAGAAATAAVEPQLLRLSKWSWWVKKSHQNGGFCSSSSPQSPMAKAALLAHSGASTYSAFPALPTPTTLFPLLCTQQVCTAAQAPADLVLLHTATGGLCSLSEMPLSHRQGFVHWCTPHAQARPWTGAASCLRSSPCCPPGPYPHSVQNERVKSLLKHEKLITLVFSLPEHGHMRGRKRWGTWNERIICKPNNQYSVSVISNLLLIFNSLENSASEASFKHIDIWLGGFISLWDVLRLLTATEYRWPTAENNCSI